MNKTKKWLVYIFMAGWVLMLASIAGIRWANVPVALGMSIFFCGALVATAYGLFTLPVVLFKTLLRKQAASRTWAFCLLGLLPLVIMLLTIGVTGLRAPAIHDITTDTANPPQLLLAAEQRTARDHSTQYGGTVIARLQARYYPHIEPLIIEASHTAVLNAVKSVATEMKWQQLGIRQPSTQSTEQLPVIAVLEATASSRIFGFKEDIAVRLSGEDGRIQVDIRSASRTGLGDRGSNAKRIKAFENRLKEKI